MPNLTQFLVGAAIVSLLFWLMIPRSKSAIPQVSAENPWIDPNDSYQLGLLAGLMGGDIPDAAALRYALQRFEQTYGRRATVQEIGIVIGFMNSKEF